MSDFDGAAAARAAEAKLARIAALPVYHPEDYGGGVHYDADEVRAIIGAVSPEAGVTLTAEQAALAASVIEEAFVGEYDRTRLERLHHLAVTLGAELPPFEPEDEP